MVRQPGKVRLPRFVTPSTTPRAFVYRHAKTLTPFLSVLHLVPSDLAVGERGTAPGSQTSGTTAHTYTNTVPTCVRSPPGRRALLLSVSTLAARNPSTRHRITRVARVLAPSAENRSDVQTFSFSRSSLWVLFPRHTTHIHAPAFYSSPANRLPRTDRVNFEFLRLFEFHLPR